MHLPIQDVKVLCTALKFFHTTGDKVGEFIFPKGEEPMEKLITLVNALTAFAAVLTVLLLALLLIVLLVGPQNVVEVFRQFIPAVK